MGVQMGLGTRGKVASGPGTHLSSACRGERWQSASQADQLEVPRNARQRDLRRKSGQTMISDCREWQRAGFDGRELRSPCHGHSQVHAEPSKAHQPASTPGRKREIGSAEVSQRVSHRSSQGSSRGMRGTDDRRAPSITQQRYAPEGGACGRKGGQTRLSGMISAPQAGPGAAKRGLTCL